MKEWRVLLSDSRSIVVRADSYTISKEDAEIRFVDEHEETVAVFFAHNVFGVVRKDHDTTRTL